MAKSKKKGSKRNSSFLAKAKAKAANGMVLGRKILGAVGLALVLMMIGAAVFGGEGKVAAVSYDPAGSCATYSGHTYCAPETSPKGGELVEIRSDGVAVYDNGGEYVNGRFRPGR